MSGFVVHIHCLQHDAHDVYFAADDRCPCLCHSNDATICDGGGEDDAKSSRLPAAGVFDGDGDDGDGEVENIVG